MQKNNITWREVLDCKRNPNECSMQAMILVAGMANYLFVSYNDVVYEAKTGKPTGHIVKDGNVVYVESESLWPTNISRYNDA